MIVIDGEGSILGRVASKVAKKLLEGEEVHLINAEKMIVSGNGKTIISKYLVRRSLKNKADPEKSPKWPRVPDMLVRRIIRGMLPYKKAKGREAYKRLKVYIGNPGYDKTTKIEEAKPGEIKKYITISELCKMIGWRG